MLVEKVGYNPVYYTAVNSSYDLPYDFYRPEQGRHRTQIEILRNDGTLIELSQVSQLVAALADKNKEMSDFSFQKKWLIRPCVIIMIYLTKLIKNLPAISVMAH